MTTPMRNHAGMERAAKRRADVLARIALRHSIGAIAEELGADARRDDHARVQITHAEVEAIERAMRSIEGRYVLGVPQGRRPREQVQIQPWQILALCNAWRRRNQPEP